MPTQTSDTSRPSVHQHHVSKDIKVVPPGLVGKSNECPVDIEGIETLCLLDSGSMISSMSESFYREHLGHLALHPLDDILNLQGAGGHSLPYSGYVEATLKFPLGLQPARFGLEPGRVLLLVVPDTVYNRGVPLLIGTNILQCLRDDLKDRFGDRYQQKAQLVGSLQVALRSLCLREKHLNQSNGVYGVVRSSQNIDLKPGEVRDVVGSLRLTVPIASRISYLEEHDAATPGLKVTSGVVSIDEGLKNLHFEVCNESNEVLHVSSGSVVCSLVEASIETDKVGDEVEKEDLDEEFLRQFKLGRHLSEDQYQKARDLLLQWKDIFSTGPFDIGCTGVSKHHINLTDNTPFQERPRRIPPNMFAEVKKHLQEMLDIGVISESCSPFSSNMVLIRKKDNSLRLCVDYRRLNARTVKDSHSLPRIDEVLDILRGSSWFSSLDLCSGFWQQEIAEEDKEKTAFSALPLGFFHFNRMAFGLSGAPSSF